MYHEDYSYGVGGVYKLEGLNRVEVDYHSDNYTSSYDYFKEVSSAGAAVGDRIDRSITHYHSANARSYLFFGENHAITAGAEYELNTLESVSDQLDHTTAYTLALFAQDEIRIVDNFYALLGARYIYHQTFKSYGTAHASLRYSLSNFNFRASYSSGFKTPTLSDIYASYESSSGVKIEPNTDLQPEKSNYYSVNAEYFNRWMSFAVTGFYNSIRDMIDYEVIASGDDAEALGYSEVRRRSNVSRAEVTGVNTVLNLFLGGGVSIGAGYTWLDAVDLESGDPINRSVRNVVTANASWIKEWNNYNLNISINGRWNDERYSSSYGYAPAYQNWDLTTRHTFTFDSIILEPSIGVENIFDYIDDRPWNSNYATLTPGRSIFVAAAIRF